MMKAGWAMLTMSRMPNEIETPTRDGRIEAAEQQPGDDGIDQQAIVRNVHASPAPASWFSFGRSLQEPGPIGQPLTGRSPAKRVNQ